MKTYAAKPKFEEDILTDVKFYFHADSQADADSKIFGWNRYHGKANCPGYGWCEAIEVSPDAVPNDGWIHNEYVN